MTKIKITRRTLLRGAAAGAPVALALPPLEAMFNAAGAAYADGAPLETRFVLWFNGNGIPEKYWIPQETGAGFAFSPCLTPLAPLRKHVHIVSGVDNTPARLPGPGNGHTNAMSGLLTGTRFTGRGAGGLSADQVVAARIGNQSRFRSLQIGVASESFGESMQRNMSWAGLNRALPPEMLPHRLFERLFGQRELGWVERQKSVLDAVRADAAEIAQSLGQSDRERLDEHVASVRDLERAIVSLPPAYKRVDPPDVDGDLKDWPRIARLQTELLVHAFASRQTRVASYMLTKCQSLTRFPWLGHTVLRHHDYTHSAKVPGTGMAGAKALAEICRWHTEEFAQLVARLKAVPEGDGSLLDRTLLAMVHEHAEANDHKNTGHGVVLAGGGGRLVTGVHTRLGGTMGDLYLTIADSLGGAATASGARSTLPSLPSLMDGFPTATKRLAGIVRA